MFGSSAFHSRGQEGPKTESEPLGYTFTLKRDPHWSTIKRGGGGGTTLHIQRSLLWMQNSLFLKAEKSSHSGRVLLTSVNLILYFRDVLRKIWIRASTVFVTPALYPNLKSH